MVNDVIEFMQSVARDIKSEFGEAVTISEAGPIGTLDYEIVLNPRNKMAATVTWFTIANTFTVSVSPNLEWQSEEWIVYCGDDVKDLKRGQEWSRDLIWRVINHGARFVRYKRPLPAFMRTTQAAVGDEALDSSLEVLEAFVPWR